MDDGSWRNRKTLILGRTDMIGLLTPAEYNDCVEHAFRMHGLGRVYMEPKGHIVLDRYPGEWEVMPSYIEEPEAAACKWVSIREDMRSTASRPSSRSLSTRIPRQASRLRSATGRITRSCARGHPPPSRRNGSRARTRRCSQSTGTGSVAKGTLATCDAAFALREVRIWSRTQSPSTASSPRSSLLPPSGFTPPPTSSGVMGADVIVTGTHARDWIVDDDWVEAGRAPRRAGRRSEGRAGARPADPAAGPGLRRDIRQCREDGEINVPLPAGLIAEQDLAGEIGKVICGELEGRQATTTSPSSTPPASRCRTRRPASRVRAGGCGRRRGREEDDLDMTTRGAVSRRG